MSWSHFVEVIPLDGPLHRDFVEAGVEAGVEFNETEAQVLRLLRAGPA